MAQSDIYDLLKRKRLSGDWKYYSAEEIRKMLLAEGKDINRNSLNNNLMSLRIFGFLDLKLCAGRKSNRAKFTYNAYRLKKDIID